MKTECCNSTTLVAKPLKYTPDGHLSSYRRKAKLDEYKKRGLI
jgi:rRNA maturation protein Nop10